MSKIIYYSRCSLLPALLAAAVHLEPGVTLEQALKRAAGWGPGHGGGEKDVELVSPGGGNGDAAFSIYAMSSPVPAELVERTLVNLANLFCNCNGRETVILVPLPFFRCGGRKERARPAGTGGKMQAFWPEIRAAVEQARLQLDWKRKLK